MNQSLKYLYCIVPGERMRGSLGAHAMDLSGMCGVGFTGTKKTLPFHLTLAPSFYSYEPRKIINETYSALDGVERFATQTSTLGIFDGRDGDGPSHVVLHVEKRPQLLNLHARLLPIIERFRMSGDGETTLYELRYGSNYVHEQYNPHITLFSVPARAEPHVKLQARIGSRLGFTLDASFLLLYEKSESNWRLLESFELK